LHDCRACVRFADVQKRQRAVLKGLSLLPIPASLFLFRAPGATAGGGAAAGSAGVATGVVAKAAAVTAAAAVAGGVGYGVAAGPDAAATADRKSAPALTVAARSDERVPTGIGRTRMTDADSAPVGPALAQRTGEVRVGKASRKKASARAVTVPSANAGGDEVGTIRAKRSLGHKAQPEKPAPAKLKGKPKQREWPAVGKRVRPSQPAYAQPFRLNPNKKAQPTRGDKPEPTTPSPSGNGSGGATVPGRQPPRDGK
jgi:hypothetical protein